MYWATGGARIELNLAKGGLIIGDILLQERHEGLGLLRAEVDALEVAQLHLGFGSLLHGAEHEEKIPDVHADLDTVGIGFAVVRSLDKLQIRLIWLIHMRSVQPARVKGQGQGMRAALLKT